MEIKITAKIVLAWELFEANVSKTHIAKRVGVLGIGTTGPTATLYATNTSLQYIDPVFAYLSNPELLDDESFRQVNNRYLPTLERVKNSRAESYAS